MGVDTPPACFSDSFDNTIYPVAIRYCPVKLFEYQRRSTFAGKRSIRRPVKRTYFVTSGKQSYLMGCKDTADIAAKINRSHKNGVGFFLLQGSHPDFKGLQTGGCFIGHHIARTSETKFSGDPAGNNSAKSAQGSGSGKGRSK